MLALRDAMAGAARALSRDWSPEDHARSGLRERVRAGTAEALKPGRLVGLAGRLLDEFGGGRLSRIFTLRLMACMGVAGLVSEVLPLQRSYWVPLTVAIVFKPDYGSVFARALQRGIGTIVGAVAGAILLVLVHGTWLLIPFAVLAALLPYGRSRNYGLLATFLTPLVVVLIDLLSPAGWRLAEDRLIDTLIGCAIVLLIGFAPWPMSWYAHLPRQYAQTALDVRRYLEEALGGRLRRGRLRAGTRRRPGRGCGGRPTGRWPTCAPSSSAPCPSRRRSAGARRPGGPPWSAWSRSWTRSPRPRWPSAAARSCPRRRPPAVRGAAGGQRGGVDGNGADGGAGVAGRRDAQAGHRGSPGAARGVRHWSAAHRDG